MQKLSYFLIALGRWHLIVARFVLVNAGTVVHIGSTHVLIAFAKRTCTKEALSVSNVKTGTCYINRNDQIRM